MLCHVIPPYHLFKVILRLPKFLGSRLQPIALPRHPSMFRCVVDQPYEQPCIQSLLRISRHCKARNRPQSQASKHPMPSRTFLTFSHSSISFSRRYQFQRSFFLAWEHISLPAPEVGRRLSGVGFDVVECLDHAKKSAPWGRVAVKIAIDGR